MNLSERQKNILRFIGIKIASSLINVLLKTVHIRIINADVINKLENMRKNYVVAFWHGSMLTGWYLQRKNNFASLVSKSKDGDILNSLLQKWQFKVVRGSSHDGGKGALEYMLQLVKEGSSLAITPDGPTGPIYKMKAGATIIAQRTEVPLLLVGIGIKSKWVLKSWDRFEIPKPFSKIVVVYSDPIFIEKNLSVEETNERILKYEKSLNNLQKEALSKC
jgi:lysophospholipid acyltransferase (LPLAT)-like uncharacterized protein